MNNYRILLIDDNHSIHKDYRKILCPEVSDTNRQLADLKAKIFQNSNSPTLQQTFLVDSVFQGQEGYEKVKIQREKGEPYALAFVDMRMPPGWDGLETITHLWEVDPELQVVIGSAYSDYEWSQITARVGLRDNLVILKKPFDKEEVLQLAHALTTKWGLHQETRTSMELLEDKVEERTQELMLANRQLKNEMRLREKMEMELRLAQKLEAIGQLAAGIAHEINTPTQFVGDNVRFFQEGYDAIQTMMRELKQGLSNLSHSKQSSANVETLLKLFQDEDLTYFSEEIPKALSETITGIERITNIVTAMKAFSHPGIEGKQVADINDLIENTVKVSTHEWKYVANIEMQLSPSLSMVSCCPNELNQVFLNLIVNAAHAIASIGGKEETKGVIRISTNEGPQGIEVAIADTGTGIPEPIQDKIFDPFFTTKEVGKGTGQGLALAYSIIVEKLKGSLRFTTKEGEGTTFYLTLPTSQDILAPTVQGNIV